MKQSKRGPRIAFIEPTEIAWAAGFFDGEGNIRFNKTNTVAPGASKSYGTLRLQVAQVHKEPLDRFQRAIGGVGKVYGPYVPTGTRRKTYHYFIVSGDKAIAAFHLLRPYLSSIKRSQGDVAIAVFIDQRTGPGRWPKRSIDEAA